MSRFSAPDTDQDKKFLDEESKKKGFDWSKVFWKPIPSTADVEEDNLVRILPARAGSGATYHARIAKHFIKHGDRDFEAFICMEDTYGRPCYPCDLRKQIYHHAAAAAGGDRKAPLSPADKEQVRKLNPKKLGIFNVVDRNLYISYKNGLIKDLPEVKIWEAPRKMVWERIVRNVASQGRTSNLFDVYDEKGVVVKPGRDVLVKFYPESDPGTMYDIQYIDPEPLGNPEEIEIWFNQIIDLIPDKISIYQPISEEEQEIRTIGTKSEREALREKRFEKAKESESVFISRHRPKKEEEGEDPFGDVEEEESDLNGEGDSPEEQSQPDPLPEEKKEEEAPPEKPKPAPEEKPKPAPEEKKEEAKEDSDLAAKIRAIKERIAKPASKK